MTDVQDTTPSAKARLIIEGEDVEISEDEVPYESLGNLGFGAHGFVEKIKDTNSGTCYARKTFRIDRAPLSSAKEMFRREVEIVRQLAPHPHVIRVHATYIAGRTMAIILQPVADGGDLAHFLSQYRDLDPSHPVKGIRTKEICRAIGCLSQCLSYFHGAGVDQKPVIRHKDIKPKNILMHEGYAIFTDFGISKRCTDDLSTSTGRPEQFTPRYCAPEVADFDRRNRKADVFSLGCVFVEMIAAVYPDLIPATIRAVDSRPYHEHVDEIRAALSPNIILRASIGNKFLLRLFPTVKRMLHRDPDLRISASEVATRCGKVIIGCKKCTDFKTSNRSIAVVSSGHIGKSTETSRLSFKYLKTRLDGYRRKKGHESVAMDPQNPIQPFHRHKKPNCSCMYSASALVSSLPGVPDDYEDNQACPNCSTLTAPDHWKPDGLATEFSFSSSPMEMAMYSSPGEMAMTKCVRRKQSRSTSRSIYGSRDYM